MAAINDLLRQIPDTALRERLEQEFARLSKTKKFGLVFEEHIPECTPLYDVTVQRGSKVARKAGKIDDLYTVVEINGETASCLHKATSERQDIPVNELIAVAQFGDPIFPSLIPIASVENAPEDSLWHTIIEADNYHALQLLEYLYEGQVDCIYIDPPYNTGARDWKYNNDYVDSADAWQHSKWLSMMKRRLLLAKKILNPADSVLVVTIDEKEVHRLGLLLDEIFPESRIQMVTIVTNPFGQERARQLARVEEYAFFIFIGEAAPCSLTDDFLNNRETTLREGSLEEVAQEATSSTKKVRWERLLRGGADALRRNNPGLFFPVFIDTEKRVIHSVGEPLPTIDSDRRDVIPPAGTIAVWPIKTNGTEGRWRCSPSYLRELLLQGYARIGEYDKQRDRWTLLYLNKSQIRRIDSGEIKVLGAAADGSVMLDKVPKQQTFSVKTVWFRPLHRAGEWGTRYIRTVLPGREFPYPKSLYAVEDTLRVITDAKPDALIVDFFAGSGTTLHAVNLLNAYDGGRRRCILVTNNEVSDTEAKRLTKEGYMPADHEWEQHGICRNITFPRTQCSIIGQRLDGAALTGDYIMPDGRKRPVSAGFPTNVEYFKLGFLNKNSVTLGRQFAEILPLLWLKSGAVGKRPELTGQDIPDMLVLPQNNFAILIDETRYAAFIGALAAVEDIQTIYFVTNSEEAFREMSAGVKAPHTYQLYRDYIDNFVLGSRRNSL